MARTKVKPEAGVVQAMLERTCCRKFSDRAVTDEQLGIVLKAGQAGPTAKNRQPYEFVIIRNPDCRKKVFMACAEGRKRSAGPAAQLKKTETTAKQEPPEPPIEEMTDAELAKLPDACLLEAPVLILLVRSSDPVHTEFMWRELDIKEEHGVACAAYSLMLAAHSLGLGMGWICSALYAKQELKAVLKDYGIIWKECWEPRAILPLGYPKGEASKPARNELQEITHFVN